MVFPAKPDHLQRFGVVGMVHLNVGIAAVLARLGNQSAALKKVGGPPADSLLLFGLGALAMGRAPAPHSGRTTDPATPPILRIDGVTAEVMRLFHAGQMSHAKGRHK